jgi:DNA-directed RNA polymerase subunit RPC12/RpoP
VSQGRHEEKKKKDKTGLNLGFVDAELKKILEEKARLSGKTLKDYLVEKGLDQPLQIEEPKIQGQHQEKDSEAQEQEEEDPVEIECFWGFKEAVSYDRGQWNTAVAICRPKSLDNDLSLMDVLRYACPRCLVFFKNRTLAKKMIEGKAARIIDLAENADEEPGYLMREARKALSQKYKCAECDFQTDTQTEAAKHQEKGYRHWFPS